MSELIDKKNKSKRGGRREGAGRKPLIDKSALEELKEEIANHGVTLVGGKKRILILLDKLFEKGSKGDIACIKEYLDRQLGKAKESIDHTSKGKTINPYSDAQVERIIQRYNSSRRAES